MIIKKIPIRKTITVIKKRPIRTKNLLNVDIEPKSSINNRRIITITKKRLISTTNSNYISKLNNYHTSYLTNVKKLELPGNSFHNLENKNEILSTTEKIQEDNNISFIPTLDLEIDLTPELYLTLVNGQRNLQPNEEKQEKEHKKTSIPELEKNPISNNNDKNINNTTTLILDQRFVHDFSIEKFPEIINKTSNSFSVVPSETERVNNSNIQQLVSLNLKLNDSITSSNDNFTTISTATDVHIIHMTNSKNTIYLLSSSENTLLSSFSSDTDKKDIEYKLTPTIHTTLSYRTTTTTHIRPGTYTYVITRVGDQSNVVTTSTEVKLRTKTLTITETLTKTFTGYNEYQTDIPFGGSIKIQDVQHNSQTIDFYDDNLENTDDDEARGIRLATRVMSNGVGVIVAGERATRRDPENMSSIRTLAPTTLTDHMSMLLPQDADEALQSNQFVTKTCMTTFTYLTTYVRDGTTTVSSREQVVSNIATEERNTHRTPEPSGITLTQNPNLATGVFHTTYTYYNTIHDGNQPIVITSKHTVANTVTAPDDYLSLLQPSEIALPIQDTNTYYSTVALTRTLTEGNEHKVISTSDVITQVVVTESIPPKSTSVMTSYIAIDVDDIAPSATKEYATTDVIKTYFVTYTYYNTFKEDGSAVVRTNVSTSSDVVTEKLYLHPKRTHTTSQAQSVIVTEPIKGSTMIENNNFDDSMKILATKTYLTTFTYFTTLLKDAKNGSTSTIINSRTKVIDNVVTETLDPSNFGSGYLESLKSSLITAENEIVTVATLKNGDEIEITAVDKNKQDKTNMNTIVESPSVITGSTIIFFDELNQIESSLNVLNSISTKNSVHITKSSLKSTNNQISKTKNHKNPASTAFTLNSQNYKTSILISKTVTPTGTTLLPGEQVIVINHENGTKSIIPVSDPSLKKPTNKITPLKNTVSSTSGVSNLLGSLNINSLTALRPVFHAIGGLIQNNLQLSRRNDTDGGIQSKQSVPTKVKTQIPPADTQSRAPIYIPVGRIADEDILIAESQNVEHILNSPLIQDNPWYENHGKITVGKPTYESPLVNGGIPISPGQVITANSDVIVGKPAIVGPRIPFIQNNGNEVPIGMQPPPLPVPKKNEAERLNYQRKPNRDDYFGPPPVSIPVPSLHEKAHNVTFADNHQHPFNSVFSRNKPNLIENGDDIGLSPPPIPQSRPNIINPISYQEVHHEGYINKNHEILSQNYNHDSHSNYDNSEITNSDNIIIHNIPFYAPTKASSVDNQNQHQDIRPVTLGDSILLPEVIERSTGQPLLVNLQPSQVANVVIPHGSATALIFGGSGEPHKNGQYFDDPSPYPEPEVGSGFSAIKAFSDSQFSSGSSIVIPRPASNVINIDSYVASHGVDINVPPLSFGIEKKDPNRLKTGSVVNLDSHVNNHNINVNVPPISFGATTEKHLEIYTKNYSSGNVYDADPTDRKENHGPIMFDNHHQKEHHNIGLSISGHSVAFGGTNHDSSPYGINVNVDHIGSKDINVNVSPHPLTGIDTHEHVGIVIDAPLNRHNSNKHYQTKHTNTQPYLHDSIYADNGIKIPTENRQPTLRPDYLRPPHYSMKPSKHEIIEFMSPPPPPQPKLNVRPQIKPMAIPIHEAELVDDDRFGDSNNQDELTDEGEVIQESKQRPLRPGEIPQEILERQPINEPIVKGHKQTQKNNYNGQSYPTDTEIKVPTNKMNGQSEVIKLPVAHEQSVYYTNIKSPYPRIPGIDIINQPQPFERRPPQTHVLLKPTVHTHKHRTQPYENSNNKYENIEKRPHPTSLPVDTSLYVTDKQIFGSHTDFKNTGSQTEQPFNSIYTKPKINYEITTELNYFINQKLNSSTSNVIKYMSTTPRPYSVKYTTRKPFNPIREILKQDLNTGEINRPRKNVTIYKPLRTTTLSTITTEFETEEKSELFVTKESTNPHNFETIQSNITATNTPLIDLQPPTKENVYDKMSMHESVEGMLPPPEINAPYAEVTKSNINSNSNPQAFIPKPSEEMKPPPPVIKYPIRNNEVMGLSPPPLTETTQKTSLNVEISTYRPPFNINNYTQRTTTNTVKPIIRNTSSTPATTRTSTSTTTTKRPYSRRPTVKQPDFIKLESTTERKYFDDYPITTRRPVFIWQRPTTLVSPIHLESNPKIKETVQDSINSESKKEVIMSIQSNVSIQPTKSVKVETVSNWHTISENKDYSSMDVSKLPNRKTDFIIVGSETSYPIENILPTKSLDDVKVSITNKVKPIKTSTEETIFDNLYTKPVNLDVKTHETTTMPPIKHHAGNKIEPKLSTTAIQNNNKKDYTKLILPTRYITHTQTLTVTTTKTTIVKSQGNPPSTLTLLITKTQTSTIVDTVTETHTLVQPTSIISTVTTTVNTNPTSTLYNPEVESNSKYPSFPVAATTVLKSPYVPVDSDEDIIITDDDGTYVSITNDNSNSNDHSHEYEENYYDKHNNDVSKINNDHSDENESIFVVMTDTKGSAIPNIKDIPPSEEEYEIIRDEQLEDNEINRVKLGGVIVASPPRLDSPDRGYNASECRPDCKTARNELCKNIHGIMRCVCRPGFARMFPDRPCKPTYTYTVRMGLASLGTEPLRWVSALSDNNSSLGRHLSMATQDALHRLLMQSDLRDLYLGLRLQNFMPEPHDKGIINTFNVQLQENTEETQLADVFERHLRHTNYSIGGTPLIALPVLELTEENASTAETLNGVAGAVSITDFDECTDVRLHDCAENAQCFNLKGTYTCSCREGFADLSENPQFPGRICSTAPVGCAKCRYHGTCHESMIDPGRIRCQCFQWYAGESCHINLKVLLIALVTLGAVLFILLLVCGILACTKRGRRHPGVRGNVPPNGGRNAHTFLPQRAPAAADTRAFVLDSASEASHSDSNTLPYIVKKQKKSRKQSASSKQIDAEIGAGDTSTYGVQRDRSLTVMIPRAKYHPAPPLSPLLTSPAHPHGSRRTSQASATQQDKLLGYLEGGKESRRRQSVTPSECGLIKAGALVSAGFEVSATVGGTEADRSENATLVHKADVLSSTGGRSQFTTLRKNSNEDIDPMADWLDTTPRVKTVSEARSYDETTIQPPTKSLRSMGGYDSKPSSQHHNNDEANTMAERDIGSTFLLPHTHLYKPDRGSDISGFDSL